MICPKCHGNNVSISESVYTEKKRRSCLWNLFMMAVTWGIWLVWMLIRRNTKTVTAKRCVCQTCGYSWSMK